ncbi:hypothetical protein BDF14DRAFT_1886994 [Spinellus fusiger]|nr:hypothetical protein BDF14DRAFT_1886994 [Spinellus fusiger]
MSLLLQRYSPFALRKPTFALLKNKQSYLPLSTIAQSVGSNKVDCYISTLDNAYINLAIEEWLLRETNPERYVLYLWRNKPCVVIGRNQNPFQECNLEFMRQNSIPLVRRRSGGGSVYHDMGNSIYTIFMPREEFSRRKNAELVSRALQQLDVPASVNDRHDIVVDGFKVSGSAYKIISKRAYHHGTMLIDADTDALRGCLSKERMPLRDMKSKGVASVPSPVTNVRNYSYTIDHQYFCESVLAEFVHDYNSNIPVEPVVFNEANKHQLPRKILETAKELQSWECVYGETPEFTNTIEHEFDWGNVHASIHSKYGMITKAELSTNSAGAHEVTVVSAISVGLRDAVNKINNDIPGLINEDNEHIVKDIQDWLAKKL